MSSTDKHRRVAIANEAIKIISSHGRKFFSLRGDGRDNQFKEDRVSYFQLRDNSRLWFIDKYTQKAIYTSYRKRHWKGFSEGGTLWRLVCEMADWIAGKRKDFPENHLGPWPKWICDGDLWGYGDDMAIVRQKIGELLASTQQTS